MAGMQKLSRIVLALAAALTVSRGWALDPTRSIAQYHHTSWTVAEGMPADIWAIAQTQDGYLWLGSVNGLYRFDGVKVERVAADVLPSPSIHTLTTTPSGGLWIGYERPVGVISYLKDGVVTNYPINATSTTRLLQVVMGPDETVWAATPDTIFRFTGERWEATESEWGSSLGQTPGGVWAFGVARDGTVWSKNLEGLYYLPPGKNRFLQAHAYSGGPEAFMTTPDGKLWTTDASRRRLYALPELGVNATAPPAPSVFGAPMANALQGPMLLDRHGRLWCGNLDDGGLCHVRTLGNAAPGSAGSEALEQFRASDGLSSNLVHTLFEDREGNIWVGTSLGLDRFRPANVVNETQVPAGFQSRFVHAAPGAIYAYTGWSNTVGRTSDGTESLYRIVPGQPPQRVIANVGRLRAVFVNDDTGKVLLVTLAGVQRLVDGRLGPPMPLPQGVEGGFVYSAVEDKDGDLWLSAFYKGVYRRRGEGPWEPVPIRSRFAATAVLIPTPDGSVWARYSGGTLYRLKGDAIEDFSGNDARIGDITLITPHELGLIFGGEGGLALFDGRKFHSLSAVDHPVLSVVTGIAQTPDGSTWIYTQAGVLRFATDNLIAALLSSDGKALRYDLIDSLDGLPGAPYGAVYGRTVAAGSDGRVWFTTGGGLAWIDPHNLYRNPLPPPVTVLSITTQGQEQPAAAPFELAAGTRNVEINYTALSLMIPERVRFRYRLDGVDEDWVEAGNRRQAFYTQLGPGRHRFQVIAANSDGVWNLEGAVLEFSIPPTFLQSKVFLVLCILAAAGLLTLLFRARLMQLSARMKTQLEARMLERERIARELHDTLLQGFQGLMLRFQSVADSIPPEQPARTLIEDTMVRGDQVLAEGRDRVRKLRGTEIVENLPSALREHAKRIASGAALDITVAVEGTPRTLHPVVNDELIAIGSEAVANAVKHAMASKIELVVAYRRGGLDVSIRDDGVGIERAVLEKGRQGHFGLAGMRERAQRIQAAFAVSSSGAGTQVGIGVPASVAYARRPARRMRWPGRFASGDI
jgi:signal transduction histidine kinase